MTKLYPLMRPNNQPQTLIILTPGFPENEEDTTCLPAQQVFVKALKKNYPNLNIIVLAFQYPFISTVYEWYGVRVISFNGGNKGKLTMPRNWFFVWKTLRQLNKENRIIGLLSFWLGECAFIGNYFAKVYGLKQFIWLLGQDAKSGNKFHSLIRPKPANLIALSDFIADEFFKNYSIRPKHTIPVGIDISLFDKEKAIRDIDIIGAGSLIPLKRYDLFIGVIKQLICHFPDIHVVICGKGPEKDQLQHQINENQLQTTITLLDEVSHTGVLALMQRSKIFLHTSSYEGFGAVCAEALYAGAHVLSFCKPMNSEIRHWHIVKQKEEILETLVELLHNSDLDHEAVLTFSINEIAEEIMKLY